ncbi:protein kinase [Pantoea sp. DY-5]|uniref:protein kinase domain-containing protein n=1 Tax=Pantoea sp. DY-5 TaxID=2871488 RepID=UPI001C97E6E2|nr:protein kinase [Pantoea sp. DY-5]MBY4839563.1 protein kinase [Pantoea sp. DY-5]
MDKAKAKRMVESLKDKKVGSWRVGKFLGSGGSALVVEGFRDGLKIALKIIDPDLEAKYGPEKQETRISYEQKLVGKNHPNLVKIYDGGRCADTKLLFVAMEYLPFKNLDEIDEPLPRENILKIIVQVAQAAQFLEELDICHRDIKPENIVITPDFERAILLDLGILMPMNPNDSKDAGTGDNFIGTIRYSPPEFVWRSEEGTREGYRAITFYQIGAVLHDLIMGRRMFDNVSGPMAKLIDSVTNQSVIIDAIDVDQRLINLARDCLQKDWQTRLRLVNWNSFDMTVTHKQDARDRIRAYMQSGSGVVLETEPVSKGVFHHQLKAIALSIRDFLRKLCLKNSDLPRALVDYYIQTDKVIVWAEFEGSTQHQLCKGARLTVVATPVDQQTAIVEAAGTWGQLDANAKCNRVGTLRSDIEDISGNLEQMLYELVANAMSNPNPKIGTSIQIT